MGSPKDRKHVEFPLDLPAGPHQPLYLLSQGLQITLFSLVIYGHQAIRDVEQCLAAEVEGAGDSALGYAIKGDAGIATEVVELPGHGQGRCGADHGAGGLPQSATQVLGHVEGLLMEREILVAPPPGLDLTVADLVVRQWAR